MRAVFYYLMTNPGAYAETVKEIDEAVARNHVASFGPVSYAQAIKLPYLCAVIKEAMRLHPSVGLTMPRHAPPEGLLIGDQHIPGGYRVGMNPAVVQRDKSVYGIDANSFRPRRWLEGDSTIMDRSMIQFGAGTRTCIGKNVSRHFKSPRSPLGVFMLLTSQCADIAKRDSQAYSPSSERFHRQACHAEALDYL